MRTPTKNAVSLRHYPKIFFVILITMKKGIWHQILTYFYLRKRDKSDERSVNMFLMHGMNRISIFVFLIAIIIMIVRLIRG